MKLGANLLIPLFMGMALASGAEMAGDGWRRFSTTDGLPANACRNVTAGANGDMLVRFDSSTNVAIFDGYHCTTLAVPGHNRVFESPGGELWTVCRQGVWEFRVDHWMLHPVPDVAESEVPDGEIRLLPVRPGCCFILMPDRLLQLAADGLNQPKVETFRRADETGLGRFTNIWASSEGGAWIAGTGGFAMLPGPLRSFKPSDQWIFTNPPPAASFLAGETGPVEAGKGAQIFDRAVAPDGSAWLATSDGLFRFTPEIWQRAATNPEPPSQPQSPVASVPPEIVGEVSLDAALITRSGDVWIGGGNRMAWFHRGKWSVLTFTNQLGPDHLVGFAETFDGRIWCASRDRIWQFDGRNWLAIRAQLGLIHSILAARDGTFWIATERGLFRYAREAWILNGVADGLPAGTIELVREDDHGTIFAKSPQGWSRFQPDADPDPPQSIILATASRTIVPEDVVMTIRFQGRDRWNQTLPGDLLFSWRLDEDEWSPFQSDRIVAASGLALGHHVFQVRALDHNGNVEKTPAQLEFSVVVPWYRDERLEGVLAVAVIVSLSLAALALNRHRHLQLSYARVGRLVAERTRQLELANRELLHSQKMNALGTLAAGIAHDFNNILSIIKGSAQIIEQNLDQPEKIRTRTARIQTVVQQGAEVVDAMLGFSRGGETPAVPGDLNAVVADTRTLLGDRFLHETEVRFEPAGNLPAISVRRDFVQQILLNFIFNADEAMTGRKLIELATMLADKLPSELYLQPAPAPGYILIRVRDHGIGIPPEIRPRIFEPFFTTKTLSTRRGTGLGLSMVYELAKKMGAGLAVESRPGVGSTFTLILPVQL
jgi:signal transduction histidine kinase